MNLNDGLREIAKTFRCSPLIYTDWGTSYRYDKERRTYTPVLEPLSPNYYPPPKEHMTGKVDWL